MCYAGIFMKNRSRSPACPIWITLVLATVVLGWCVCKVEADDGVSQEPVAPHVDRNTPFFINNCGLVEVSATDPWEFAVCYNAHIRTGTGPCTLSCNPAATCGTAPDTGHGVICWPPQPPPQGQTGSTSWQYFVTYLNQSCSTANRTIPVKYYRRIDPASMGYAFNLSNLTGWNYANGLYVRPGVPFVLYDGGPHLDHVASGPNGGNFVSAYYQLYAGFGQCAPGMIEPGTVYIGNANERNNHVAMIGTQSLAIGLNPSILAVNTNTAWRQNAATHHTMHYYTAEALTGVPSIGLTQILRRGERATFEVEVSNSFSTTCHDIAMKLWDTQTPGGEWIRVPPRNNPANPTSWGVEVLDVQANPNGSRQILTVEVSVPVTAPIGRYSAYFAIEYAQSGVEITDEVLDGPPEGQFIILFNPWNTLDETAFSSVSDERHVRRVTDIIFRDNNLVSARPWNVHPQKSLILDEALRFLQGSPAIVRAKPDAVGRWLAQRINGRNNSSGMLRGSWPVPTNNRDPYRPPNHPSGGNPRCDNVVGPTQNDINFMGSIPGSVAMFSTWRDTGRAFPISFAQCWIYAGVTCSALRTLGIPSRIVSGDNILSDMGSYTPLPNANEVSDGRIMYYYAMHSTRNVAGSNMCRMNDYSWTYHVWNEMCIRSVNLSTPQWHVIDATPAHAIRPSRSASARSIGPASLADVRVGEFNNLYDVKTAFSMLNAGTEHVLLRRNGTDRRNWANGGMQFPDNTSIETDGRLLGQSVNSIFRLQLSSNYVSVIAPPLATLPPPTWLVVPSSYSFGETVIAQVRFDNPSDIERTYDYEMVANAISVGDGIAQRTVGEMSGQVVVAPHSLLILPMVVPWEQLSAETPVLPLEFVGSIGYGPGDDECYATAARVNLTTPTMSLDTTAVQSHPNGVVNYNMQFDALLPITLNNVRVEFLASGELGLFAPNSFERVVNLGTLAQGSSLSASAVLRSRIAGEETVMVRVYADEFCYPFVTAGSVFISGCGGDFDDSGGVSPQDLFTFLGVWFVESAQPCAWGLASDINGDGCVTVQDMFDFIAAYFTGC